MAVVPSGAVEGTRFFVPLGFCGLCCVCGGAVVRDGEVFWQLPFSAAGRDAAACSSCALCTAAATLPRIWGSGRMALRRMSLWHLGHCGTDAAARTGAMHLEQNEVLQHGAVTASFNSFLHRKHLSSSGACSERYFSASNSGTSDSRTAFGLLLRLFKNTQKE